jgi:MerR family redox-sensitive transcriptional activator SoxR
MEEGQEQELFRPLTIGEVAERTGVATSALRFYEERGLIHAERTSVGHRRYPRAVLRRVAFIVFAQRVGFTLEEIRVELDRLPRHRVPTGADWDRLTRAWNARIAERIAELERLRRGLGDCIGCGCLSLERCKILNPYDRVACRGSGPRFWLGDRRPAK